MDKTETLGRLVLLAMIFQKTGKWSIDEMRDSIIRDVQANVPTLNVEEYLELRDW